MSARTEAVKAFFAAINRNDMQALAACLDPEIVRIEPEDFPTAGTYRGIDVVRQHIASGRATWAEGACEPSDLVENGDKVVASVYIRVRLKSPDEWVSGRIADGFEFRDDKIIQFRSFHERAEALKWAGIND